MNFNGVPLHPLVVHAAVVLTPLAALLAIIFALVPRWRWLARWPLVLVAVVGAGATYVAARTGDDLKDRLGLGEAGVPAKVHDLMEAHEMWASRLEVAMVVLVASAIIGAYVMPFTSPIAGRAEREARLGLLRIPVAVVLVLAGAATLYAVYRTGDAGAHLVWDGTPK